MSISALVVYVIAIILGVLFYGHLWPSCLSEKCKEINLGYPLAGFLVIFISALIFDSNSSWILKKNGI